MNQRRLVVFHPVMVLTGGVETFLLRLIEDAPTYNVEVVVICATTDVVHPNIVAIGQRFFIPGLGNVANLPRADAVLATGLTGLVAAHHHPQVRRNEANLKLMLFFTTEVNWEGMDQMWRSRIAESFMAGSTSNSVIFPTGFTRTVTARRYPQLQDSRLIPMPIRSGARSSSATQPSLADDPRDSARFSIVSVGRLEAFKSYNLWMIEAVRLLRSEGIPAVWDVYGTGPVEAQMRRLGSDLIAAGAMRLHGLLPYSEFERTVQLADCFVGVGTAAFEAGLSGTPVIVPELWTTSQRCVGFIDECIEFSAGEPLSDGTSSNVLDLLRQVAAMSPGERTERGLACRAFVQKTMTTEVVLPQLFSLLFEASSAKPLSPGALRRDAYFLFTEKVRRALLKRETQYQARYDITPV